MYVTWTCTLAITWILNVSIESAGEKVRPLMRLVTLVQCSPSLFPPPSYPHHSDVSDWWVANSHPSTAPLETPRHCISITRRWHDCYFFLSVFVSAPFYCFVYTDSAQPVSQDSKYKRISCKVESRQNCLNSLFTSQLFHCCRILILQHYF